MVLDAQRLKPFFMWCTIINGTILVLATLGTVLAPEPGASLQSQWFEIPPETLKVALYLFLGLFKIFWLVFNVVPYVALLIVGNRTLAAH